MALINCPECNSQASDKAKECPKCGHPMAQSKPRNDLNEIMSDVNPFIKSKRQKYFEGQRKALSDREIQMEMLYAQQILIEKIDKVRANTNTMIWFLIVIPIILAVIIAISSQ